MSCEDHDEDEAVTDDECSVASSDFECEECKLKCEMNESGDFECFCEKYIFEGNNFRDWPKNRRIR